LENELKAMKMADASKRKKKKKLDTAQGDAPDGSGVDVGQGVHVGQGMDSGEDVDAGESSFPQFVHVEDPVTTTTKGCPGEK
jgi:hypothetical protein